MITVRFNDKLARKYATAIGATKNICMDFITDGDELYFKYIGYNLMLGVNKRGQVLLKDTASVRKTKNFCDIKIILENLDYYERLIYLDYSDILEDFGTKLFGSLKYINKDVDNGVIELDTDIIEFVKVGTEISFRYTQFA